MSLFGALGTAVSGLAGQAAAFTDISDNVANSQTTGFKRIDTAFTDYLTTSTQLTNQSGSVIAHPLYENNVQGSITENDNPLAFAISGSGFFSVSRATQTINGVTNFSPQTYYTRAGDFQLNSQGYLVNSEGDYLNGWKIDATGVPERNAVAPIQITQTLDSPVPTKKLNLSANLPSYIDPTKPPAAIKSTANIYDAQGAAHTLTLNFTPTNNTAGSWDMQVMDDGAANGGTPQDIGDATVTFGPDGALASIAGSSPSVTPTSSTGDPAVVTLTTNYNVVTPAVPPATQSNTAPQKIALNLGIIGGTSGLTEYAGKNYTLRGISQDGVPPGSFKSLTNTSAGDIVANFDNGQSRVVARAPIVTFASANQLQRQDGSAFTATVDSGDPLAHDAGTSGAGSLVTSATEASNVDISAEFSKLIVAQRAYSANAKMITTADDMLNTTIDMKR